MSTQFSAREVCEFSLQKVGASPPSDSGAEGDLLARTLKWLDLVMAELAGSQRIFWLVPASPVVLPLTGAQATYVLADDATAPPVLGFQFPIEATLLQSNGTREPLKIVTLEEYEMVNDKTLTGTPDIVFIDRLGEPSLSTHPVLGSAATGYSIELVVQTYAPAFSDTQGEVATQLRQAWQLWAILATSYEIGSGPVRVLEDNRLNRLKEDRDMKEARLLAFENRQHATSSGRIIAKDF